MDLSNLQEVYRALTSRNETIARRAFNALKSKHPKIAYLFLATMKDVDCYHKMVPTWCPTCKRKDTFRNIIKWYETNGLEYICRDSGRNLKPIQKFLLLYKRIHTKL